MPSHVSNLESLRPYVWIPSSYKIHQFKKKTAHMEFVFENKQYRHWFNECRFAGWYSFWLDMLWSACNSCDGFSILGPLELQRLFGWFTGAVSKRAWKVRKNVRRHFRASAKIFRTSRWMSKFSVSVFCDFAVFVGMCVCVYVYNIYIYKKLY